MTERRISRRACLRSLAAAPLLAGGCSALSRRGAKTSAEPFSIVALPDTQLYSQSHPEVFMRQTEWIRDHRGEHNIVFVVHEGDIVNGNSEPEWRNADAAMRVLDGIVPYALAPGNHDMGPGGSARTRDTTLYNRFFPVSRYQDWPSYGGHFGSTNDNSYHFFTGAGSEFLVIALEFGPRNEVLQWANTVLGDHRDRRAILVTHCYMYSDDTRVGEGDDWNPHAYGCGGNDGEEIWAKCASLHPNLFLVLSGHILHDGLGRLTSTGLHKNPVHQILANYQMKPNGGNGWLRVLTFLPADNRISVWTYSPWLDEHATDADNRFDLPLMPV